jgi:hypothetical protein
MATVTSPRHGGPADALDVLIDSLRELLTDHSDREHAAYMLSAIWAVADSYADPEGAAGRLCLVIAEAVRAVRDDG